MAACTAGAKTTLVNSVMGPPRTARSRSRSTALPEAVAIAAGDSNSCAIVEGGSVQCWGNNVFGALGDGTTTNSSLPVAVIPAFTRTRLRSRFTTMPCCICSAPGRFGAGAITAAGSLGNGSTSNSSRPVDGLRILSGVWRGLPSFGPRQRRFTSHLFSALIKRRRVRQRFAATSECIEIR